MSARVAEGIRQGLEPKGEGRKGEQENSDLQALERNSLVPLIKGHRAVLVGVEARAQNALDGVGRLEVTEGGGREGGREGRRDCGSFRGWALFLWE